MHDHDMYMYYRVCMCMSVCVCLCMNVCVRGDVSSQSQQTAHARSRQTPNDYKAIPCKLFFGKLDRKKWPGRREKKKNTNYNVRVY